MSEIPKLNVPNPNSGSFTINNTSEEFAQRQKNVFDKLNGIQYTKVTADDDSIMENEPESIHLGSDRTQKKITKQFRNRESIFKRPHVPVRTLSKKIPDYCLNPHKWTKYSLEDVRNEDMSERGNTAAALSFLKELADRKDKTETNNEDAETTKIVFRRNLVSSNTLKSTHIDTDEKTFRNSKVVMPEYVVGQKIKKMKKNRQSEIRNSSKELKLDHLLDEDNEDE